MNDDSEYISIHVLHRDARNPYHVTHRSSPQLMRDITAKLRQPTDRVHGVIFLSTILQSFQHYDSPYKQC